MEKDGSVGIGVVADDEALRDVLRMGNPRLQVREELTATKGVLGEMSRMKRERREVEEARGITEAKRARKERESKEQAEEEEEILAERARVETQIRDLERRLSVERAAMQFSRGYVERTKNELIGMETELARGLEAIEAERVRRLADDEVVRTDDLAQIGSRTERLGEEILAIDIMIDAVEPLTKPNPTGAIALAEAYGDRAQAGPAERLKELREEMAENEVALAAEDKRVEEETKRIEAEHEEKRRQIEAESVAEIDKVRQEIEQKRPLPQRSLDYHEGRLAALPGVIEKEARELDQLVSRQSGLDERYVKNQERKVNLMGDITRLQEALATNEESARVLARQLEEAIVAGAELLPALRKLRLSLDDRTASVDLAVNEQRDLLFKLWQAGLDEIKLRRDAKASEMLVDRDERRKNVEVEAASDKPEWFVVDDEGIFRLKTAEPGLDGVIGFAEALEFVKEQLKPTRDAIEEVYHLEIARLDKLYSEEVVQAVSLLERARRRVIAIGSRSRRNLEAAKVAVDEVLAMAERAFVVAEKPTVEQKRVIFGGLRRIVNRVLRH